MPERSRVTGCQASGLLVSATWERLWPAYT